VASEDDLWSVLGLAVLQGLTEFLPVSSSGHLVLGRELFGLRSIDGVLITVALHVGTLVAVLGVYGSSSGAFRLQPSGSAWVTSSSRYSSRPTSRLEGSWPRL
jgi:undecaprenyl pyrophosphate phosphatase UppP